MTDLTNIVYKLQNDEYSFDELIQLLNSDSAFVRVNSLESVSRKVIQNPELANTSELVSQIVKTATDEIGAISIVSFITVKHFSIACLLKIGTREAQNAAKTLIEHFTGDDLDDLLWFLESEGNTTGI